MEKYVQTEESDEFRYFNPLWLKELAKGLTEGAKKYPNETWKNIPAKEHVFRAMRHLNEFQINNSIEDLIHASMRCMLAFSVLKINSNNNINMLLFDSEERKNNE